MCTVLELLYVLFSVTALNFPFDTRCSNEQLKNVLLLFGFQDKCPIEFVLSRTFVLFQSKWKWAPDIVLFCDWSTNGILLPNENEVTELLSVLIFSKNGIEIDFMSTEGLKTIISHPDRPIVQMLDRCGHPDEKCIVKLKHCTFIKNSSYTTCGNPRKAIHMQHDSLLPRIWPRSRDSKTIDDQNFVWSYTTIALSTACCKTISTSFSAYFHICR